MTFKTEEELKTAILHLSNALQKIDLSDIAVTPIEVLSEKYAKTLDKNKGSGNATSQVPPAMCPEVVNNGTNGAVEVRVVSDVGCFKLYTSGRELNAESTSNLSFRSDPGIFSTKVYMDNGIMIEKKMLIGDDYELAYFQIKQKNGKYMLKLSMANSRGKEAPVELTETTFAPDETTCKDKLYLWQQGDPLRNLTVVGITRTHVRYVDCFHPDKVIEIHKNEVSEVVYANGTEDEIASSRIDGKADYDENLIRTREDVYQRHLTKL